MAAQPLPYQYRRDSFVLKDIANLHEFAQN
jgi:hypothetical protein